MPDPAAAYAARPKVEEETKEIAEEGERSKLNLFFISH